MSDKLLYTLIGVALAMPLLGLSMVSMVIDWRKTDRLEDDNKALVTKAIDLEQENTQLRAAESSSSEIPIALPCPACPEPVVCPPPVVDQVDEAVRACIGEVEQAEEAYSRQNQVLLDSIGKAQRAGIQTDTRTGGNPRWIYSAEARAAARNLVRELYMFEEAHNRLENANMECHSRAVSFMWKAAPFARLRAINDGDADFWEVRHRVSDMLGTSLRFRGTEFIWLKDMLSCDEPGWRPEEMAR